jgi:hypothetical protein
MKTENRKQLIMKIEESRKQCKCKGERRLCSIEYAVLISYIASKMHVIERTKIF